METLIVRQFNKNKELVKTWKLREKSPRKTFGSTPTPDLYSKQLKSSRIPGSFEFKEGTWLFTSDLYKSIKIDSSKIIQMENFDLYCTLQEKPRNLINQLELTKDFSQTSGNKKYLQLYTIKKNEMLLETKLLPLNKDFKSSVLQKEISCKPSPHWNIQVIDGLTFSQKTISLFDESELENFKMSDIFDKESQKASILLVGVFIFLLGISFFIKPIRMAASVPNQYEVTRPLSAKNIFKHKVKRPSEINLQKFKALKESLPPSIPSAGKTTSEGRVSQMIKSLSGGRISTLIGKVSSRGSKSSVLFAAQGIKASAHLSGPALSNLGNIERNGSQWNGNTSHRNIVISTAGKGGGKNIVGNGLSAGITGTKGVGLIEEEGEIIGGLDREVIAQYIKSQLGQILYCYERQLSASPELLGKVSVNFTIGSNGQVERQLIQNSSLKSSSVEGCILNRVAGWKFPTPQGGTKVIVTYPFLFKSTN